MADLYGMERVAYWRADLDRFHVELGDHPTLDAGRCVYAFLGPDGGFLRIGSSKGKLRGRLRAYVRDLTNATHGRRSPSADWEPEAWRSYGEGEVWARPGTVVTTPVGTFECYLDEESVLIGRHRPPLNRSKHR